jgi:glycosidase
VDQHASGWEWRRTIDGWFANKLPDLNPDNPLVAQYVLDNALWWMEIAGLDAFRLDTFPYSSRRFWSGWNEGIFRAYSHTTTIGEVWDQDVTITSFFPGGRAQYDGIDTHLSSVFDFPLYFAIRDVVIKGQPVRRIVDVLQRDWLYPHPERLVTFIGNHDTRRFMGEEGSSKAKLEAAFALLLTMRGIPEIYSGDEIAMPGGDDPDNRRDFPGGFPGDAHNAFEKSGRTADENEIFDSVRALVKLRRDHSALQNGSQTHIAWDTGYYAFLRSDSRERLLVMFNNSPSSRTVTLSLSDTPLENARRFEPLYAAQRVQVSGVSIEVPMAPTSVSIYEVK